MKKTTTLLLILISVFANAQINSSYNANSIPVNGGNFNTAFGIQALYSNEGTNNTAMGFNCLFNNTTGVDNTASGISSLYANTTGFNNTSSGSQSLFNNTTGSYNTASGAATLSSNIIGNGNTAFGSHSLFKNTKGENNVALGYRAGYNSTGSGNIYIGNFAGHLNTSNNKLYVGNDAGSTTIYGNLATRQILLGGNDNEIKWKQTLAVMGGIVTDSIRTTVNSWADYVFDEDYKLMPLDKLRDYLKISHHLPNIPSADEVVKNGINVSEMTVKLLEKIEELHLYIIQQQKRIDKLENR